MEILMVYILIVFYFNKIYQDNEIFIMKIIILYFEGFFGPSENSYIHFYAQGVLCFQQIWKDIFAVTAYYTHKILFM